MIEKIQQGFIAAMKAWIQKCFDDEVKNFEPSFYCACNINQINIV